MIKKLSIIILTIAASAACGREIKKTDDGFAARIAAKNDCRANPLTRGVVYTQTFAGLPNFKPDCAFIVHQAPSDIESYTIGIKSNDPDVMFYGEWQNIWDRSVKVPTAGVTYNTSLDKKVGGLSGGTLARSDYTAVTGGNSYYIDTLVFHNFSSDIGTIISVTITFTEKNEEGASDPVRSFSAEITAPLYQAP